MRFGVAAQKLRNWQWWEKWLRKEERRAKRMLAFQAFIYWGAK